MRAAYNDPLATTAFFRHRASAEPCYVEVVRGQSSGKKSTVNSTFGSNIFFPWTDELGRIHCLERGRLIHTGTAVLGNQRDFYKPPPLTEADMKFLRDLAALDKADPLVRAHHEDLFPRYSWNATAPRSTDCGRSTSCSTSTTPMRSKIGTLPL